ncbi:excinuclease ABC subunit UvrB [Candidatus Woesearchaeota archaeon]|nr:excinuclease ABC subunit UvrB [Candidatus Woesearchaeota archaeon]
MTFKLVSRFPPAGGQPEAIEKLTQEFQKQNQKQPDKKTIRQTLLGITGSGKTFVMANVIQRLGKKTLVLAHNKTLAAQLYAEFKELFPENRVEYFISYYDYYQPESYLPTTDTYIEKESTVNEEIEKLRLKTMTSLLSRDDVIVVASISCIYGAGNPQDFAQLSQEFKKKDHIKREKIIAHLVAMLYERNDMTPSSGNFRVRGDVIDIFPSYDDIIIRIELFGDEIERISELHPITGIVHAQLDQIRLFPAKQFVVPEEKQDKAMAQIRHELKEQLPTLPLLEAERLRKRVNYDLEMMREMGYCTGIENYSRHFDGRTPGQPPFCLLDYFGDDFLLIIDESHQTIPQSRGMYHGDYSRKKNLVEYGFRLPCAYDNRPLKFEEFERYFKTVLFVSATPSEYELQSSSQVVELIIRPTGLLDPTVEVRPIEGQIKDILEEIKKTVAQGERVLVTTLTKRMAEDLTEFLAQKEVKVRYMHSEIDSLERIELLRGLRAGDFDVLVGINLLREGLDLPEVSLVAILDADKEGFLRDERSLIQTIGRAARNVHGRVIMYADVITKSIRGAVGITQRRREDQIKFNAKHGIVPQTVIKTIEPSKREIKGIKHLSPTDLQRKVVEIEAEMLKAAEELQFEKAIDLRDTLEAMKAEIGSQEREREYQNQKKDNKKAEKKTKKEKKN